jgi:uncharacterized membrane protein YcaP (DUF421 family)
VSAMRSARTGRDADHASDPFEIGADDRFDLLLTRARRGAWLLLIPVIAVVGMRWQSTGSAVPHTVLRAALVYLMVLAVLRLAGKRTLGEMNTFDFAILLILSEAVQPALVGDDLTLTNAALILCTLVGFDAFLGLIKDKSRTVSRWLEDVPAVLMEDGVPRRDALTRHRVDIEDLLEAARQQHGTLTLAEVRHAILERAGGISVIPWRTGEACSCGGRRAARTPEMASD